MLCLIIHVSPQNRNLPVVYIRNIIPLLILFKIIFTVIPFQSVLYEGVYTNF